MPCVLVARRAFFVKLNHFFNMIDVIKRAQSLNNLTVRFVFFEFLATDRNRNGIDTKS